METTILVGLTYRWRRLEGAAMLAGRKGRRGLATEAHQEEGGVSRKRAGRTKTLVASATLFRYVCVCVPRRRMRPSRLARMGDECSRVAVLATSAEGASLQVAPARVR